MQESGACCTISPGRAIGACGRKLERERRPGASAKHRDNQPGDAERKNERNRDFCALIRADQGNLSRVLARYLLTLGFDQEDRDRMSDLAERNQEGALEPDEVEELQNYVKAGNMLALLHSKARRSLRGLKRS